MRYSRSADSEHGPLDGFLRKYPADDRAQDFLLSSSPEVVERVIRDFRPHKEGEENYSGLLTSFVKKVRQRHQQQQEQPRAERGYSRRDGDSGRAPDRGSHELRRTVDKFCRRYPVDDDAYGWLAKCPTDIALRVMRDFRPQREGEADYSALLKTFVKRCLAEGSSSATYSSSRGRDRSRGGDRRSHHHRGGRSSPVEDFLRRYPVDNRAYDYFTSLPSEVQDHVMAEFRPKREGEADYSSLLTTFITRCRQDSGGRDRAPRASAQHWQEAAGSMDQTALEVFRERYPMDDRAFEYLSTSPPEVREQILTTFEPRRSYDNDFSAPVTAYIRECRKLLGFPGPSATGREGGHPRSAPPPHSRASPPPVRLRRRSRSRRRRGRELEGGLSDDSREPAAAGGDMEEVLRHFVKKYPVDNRAYEFLSTSDPDVVMRVVQEFVPKREGESDYSALVTTFVKRCRDKDGPSRGGEARGDTSWRPWKRARHDVGV